MFMISKINKFLKLFWFNHNTKSEIISMGKNDKNNEGDFWDFLLGLGLGSLGMVILSIFTKPKLNCPVCKNKIEKGIEKCPHCNTLLSWKKK